MLLSLTQMFDNIATLKFLKGTHNEWLVAAMCSSEGEVMDYRTPVTADGRVEDWMSNVLSEMRRSNRLITKEAIYFYCQKGITRCVHCGCSRCSALLEIYFSYFYSTSALLAVPTAMIARAVCLSVTFRCFVQTN